jgi:hypothetical protein
LHRAAAPVGDLAALGAEIGARLGRTGINAAFVTATDAAHTGPTCSAVAHAAAAIGDVAALGAKFLASAWDAGGNVDRGNVARCNILRIARRRIVRRTRVARIGCRSDIVGFLRCIPNVAQWRRIARIRSQRRVRRRIPIRWTETFEAIIAEQGAPAAKARQRERQHADSTDGPAFALREHDRHQKVPRYQKAKPSRPTLGATRGVLERVLPPDSKK